MLSLFYLLGMSVVYTLLGGIAALTGMMFGKIQSSPAMYLVIANVCVLMGLSMLDVFSLPLPAFHRGETVFRYCQPEIADGCSLKLTGVKGRSAQNLPSHIRLLAFPLHPLHF